MGTAAADTKRDVVDRPEAAIAAAAEILHQPVHDDDVVRRRDRIA